MVLTTKIKDFKIENKYIDIDKRVSFLDLDLNRIMTFSLELEQNKYKSIMELYPKKINELMNLKFKLNLKKKIFIDILRQYYKKVSYNPLNNLILDNKQINIFKKNENKFIELLLKYKVIPNDLIAFQIKINIFFNGYNNIVKLLNIDNDIKTIEKCIKEFHQYIKDLKKTNPFIYDNPHAKINQLDLDYLTNFKTKKITSHIKEIYYFYMIMIKKSRIKTNNILNHNGQFKQKFNLISQEDILKCIEKNHINNIDNINNMTNKRINNLKTFILNKWF